MIINTLNLELLAAHFLGDFCFQSDRQVQAKKNLSLWAFFLHAVFQAVLAYIFVGLWKIWEIPTIIFLSHLIIDLFKELVTKCFAPQSADGKPIAAWKFWSIVIDQLLHIAVIFALVAFLDKGGKTPGEPYWGLLIGQSIWRQTLVLLTSVILTVCVGGIIVGTLVAPFLIEIQGPEDTLKPEQRGLEDGGKRIGQLERILILFFILTNQPAGVGFLLTAKSIFRFGELKDSSARKEAEYIIIGTMLSFTWALLVAWCTQCVLQVT